MVNPEAADGTSSGNSERLTAANAALESATRELSSARREFQQAQSRLDEISNQPEQSHNTSDLSSELAPKYELIPRYVSPSRKLIAPSIGSKS